MREYADTGRAAGWREYPPRQHTAIGADRPARAGCQVHEWQFCGRDLDHFPEAAGRTQVVERRTVAAQQDMRAVVDRRVETRIVERAAPAAGLRRGFVQDRR